MEVVTPEVEFQKWRDDSEKWNSRIHRKWMEVLNRKNFGARARPRGPVVEIFDIFKFFPLIFFPFFLFFFLFFLPRPEAAENFGKKSGYFWNFSV